MRVVVVVVPLVVEGELLPAAVIREEPLGQSWLLLPVVLLVARQVDGDGSVTAGRQSE